MKKQVVNLENKKVKDLDINTNVFGIKPLPDIIHQYIRYQNAKSRQGTHKTKTRSEVNGRAKNLSRKKVLVMQDKEVVNHLTLEVEQFLWALFQEIIHFR